MRSSKRYLCFAVISIVTTTFQVQASSNSGVAAITRPSADVTLSFVQPGRIAEVLIKEGESVQTDQILVRLDDAVELARLAQLEAESKKTTDIEAAEASLAQKRVDLRKLQTAAEHKAATELEVEHAKLDVTIAALSLELAIFEHEQAIRKYDEARLQLDYMRLKSPIDGRVEKIDMEIGESVNALDSVARVVRIDPLWIDVPVPLSKTNKLKCGDIASVQFPAPDGTSVDGKIIFVGAVADAASGTLRVRVEVPNKSKRPAGEHVKVAFPNS